MDILLWPVFNQLAQGSLISRSVVYKSQRMNFPIPAEYKQKVHQKLKTLQKGWYIIKASKQEN